MDELTAQNKRAWEYRAYEHWNRLATPAEKAQELIRDPLAAIRFHEQEFDHVRGLSVANVCGSNGRRAVAIALLGARTTVFDISAENCRYALELARAAGVSLDYVLGDFCQTAPAYAGAFHIAYMEGGILHYFPDLPRFTRLLYAILKPGGRLILSDFHPFRKLDPANPACEQCAGDYFDRGIHTGDLAYKPFFPAAERVDFPPCRLRYYTLEEILGAVLDAGFVLRRFREVPDWGEGKRPGEFVIYAGKP